MLQNRTHSRRAMLQLSAAAVATSVLGARAEPPVPIKVFKDPGCGCCDGWVEHVRANGFAAEVVETTGMPGVKTRLGVPADLGSCHTAQIAGYVIEGHVPAHAIRRLLEAKPQAAGLSAPGMPIGSPGMEGGRPEIYDVVLFGPGQRTSFGRYRGATPV